MSTLPNLDDYPTMRVESYRNGKRTIVAEFVRADHAMDIARSTWRNQQPLDKVLVVNERTGFTRDEIGRDRG